ncbi:MAG: hypothetical protein ACYDDP_07665 [Acidithiobacillus sp.]
MVKKRAPEMTQARWLVRAQSAQVRGQITTDQTQEDFQAIIHVAARRQILDWEEAVALLHMVYGWMPTMLRTIDPHTPAQRSQLLAHLQKVKTGGILTATELANVKRFANRSVVGASKLLHVLNPANYVIWDSRVAEAFLWSGVTLVAYSTIDRYMEYLEVLRQWAMDSDVIRECAALRQSNPMLAASGDLRLIELVLFCKS